jgi:glycosyltransferase involved in cell wall biosynthesis
MKVLFFSMASFVPAEVGIHGTGHWASSLVNAININRNDLEIYYAYHDPEIREIKIEVGKERISIIKIPINGNKSKIGKLFDKWSFRDLYVDARKNYLCIIDKIQPDIIQIFGLETPLVRLIGNTSIPIIIHLQGLLPPYMFKYYPRFTSFQLLRFVKFKSFLKAQTSFHKKVVIKRHIRLEETRYSDCHYFFGRTDWDRYISGLIAPGAKYFYCQEILREPFYKIQWQQNCNIEFRIFTTIRDVFYKNTDIVFETVHLLEKFYPDFRFNWYLAGVDENDITVRIMRWKGFKSINLVLLGMLDADDLILEMLKSDLFVIPSAIENSPNALQEAMLLGMPIIATHAGGISSLIDHTKTGLLVPEGEPFSLAGAIIELSKSKDLMVSMGNAARSVALKRNDPGNVLTSLLTAYNDILNNNEKSL